jgi:hypothetical protein
MKEEDEDASEAIGELSKFLRFPDTPTDFDDLSDSQKIDRYTGEIQKVHNNIKLLLARVDVVPGTIDT